MSERIVPPRAGYHHRALALVAALRDLGFRVAVAGLAADVDQPVGPEFGEAVLPPTARVAPRLEPGSWAERQYLRIVGRLDRREGGFGQNRPSLRRWFTGVVEAEQPCVVLMSYARWSRLLPSGFEGPTLCDENDLVSVNERMRRTLSRDLRKALDSGDFSRVSDPAYFASFDTRPSRSELLAFDRFDVTLAITEQDAAAIRDGIRHTRVVTLPATAEPVDVGEAGQGPAVFVGGAHPFNVQGYLFFVQRVLPLLRERLDAFELQVVGDVADGLPAPPGVSLAGYVPDLGEIYGRCRFAICPVVGGTGEKVKIIEAMAHGRPVVALGPAAQGSPLIHDETGFVAATGADFAEHCANLWADSELRIRMGTRARQVVEQDRGPALLRRTLTDVLPPHLVGGSRLGAEHP